MNHAVDGQLDGAVAHGACKEDVKEEPCIPRSALQSEINSLRIGKHYYIINFWEVNRKMDFFR
jgi:hypothetical protein